MARMELRNYNDVAKVTQDIEPTNPEDNDLFVELKVNGVWQDKFSYHTSDVNSMNAATDNAKRMARLVRGASR